ncbi:MAG: hypothetical protein H6923_07335 [Alphaproteobacteria bacterium]|nr:hypothetical protein [Alphaproteobacteria bacterium]
MTEQELWAEYNRLSQLSRFMPATNRAWALDDTLNYILNRIEAGNAAECTLQQIENRIGNAKAKFRKRARLQAASIVPEPVTAPPAEDRVEVLQRLARCSRKERLILVAAGMGHGAEEIARALSAPVGSVKTWTFRARAKFSADKLAA